MRTTLAWLLALAVAFSAMFIVGSMSAGRITEEDPRWNCHTQGNHVCGTGTRPPLPNHVITIYLEGGIR